LANFIALGPVVDNRFFGLFCLLRWSAPELTTLMSMLYRFRMAVNLGGMLDKLIPNCFATFSASTYDANQQGSRGFTRWFSPAEDQ
jgi:hypothetical protein